MFAPFLGTGPQVNNLFHMGSRRRLMPASDQVLLWEKKAAPSGGELPVKGRIGLNRN